MTLGLVRRVVTGHESDGRAVVVLDERVATRIPVEGLETADLWTTETPRARISIAELAPGHQSPMHRTQSVDYAILLSGSVELHLDGGDVVRLEPGDVVIQRGTNHAWVVPPDGPARLAFVLIQASPVVIDGVELPDTMPPGVEP